MHLQYSCISKEVAFYTDIYKNDQDDVIESDNPSVFQIFWCVNIFLHWYNDNNSSIKLMM